MTAEEARQTLRKYTPEEIQAKRREWASRGGRSGKREDKRRAILTAWANPDPSKRPGRKKGSPRRLQQPGKMPLATRPTSPVANLNDEYNRVMAQLRGNSV